MNLNLDYKNKLTTLNIKNNKLSERIERLNPNSLDLDFLDEKIREKTGYLSKDELLIKFDN